MARIEEGTRVVVTGQHREHIGRTGVVEEIDGFEAIVALDRLGYSLRFLPKHLHPINTQL